MSQSAATNGIANHSAATPDYQTLMKQAVLELRDLKTKLNALETAKTEPIAIVGMGCRLPGGANDPDAFWELLSQGVDAITEVPPDRWDIDDYYDPDSQTPGKMHSRYGGFVQQLYEFDPAFFGLSPREAVSLDPQQRLLLEVSWEALEQAGLAIDSLAGSRTGVFIGICSSDYSQILLDRGPEAIDAYMGTGNTHSVAAGRLSYLLGLQGPCVAVDTACSSSLVTVHLACQSLRNDECELALVGGVNRILTPEATINFSKAQMLAADGRCKTFDASADGYVRAEGCGMILLKRLSKALADGDRILALVRGSAVNQDGRSTGLTVPNGPAQQALIRQALENGGINPLQISYVEAHGTGTALGDPIEVGALGAVYGKGRSADQPLFLGSVKTNIGHLEGAAGIAGLLKVVLALYHKQIPPHLHFQQPNPHIDWTAFPLKIPIEPTPWIAKTRLAGVSSFGFSGTNAHVILQEAPTPDSPPAQVDTPEQPLRDRPLHLLTLSAKSAAALKPLAERYQHYLSRHLHDSFADICFTAHISRSSFDHRLSLVAASATQACEKLAAFVEDQTTGFTYRQRQETDNPEVVFLFTGQGSQFIGMGQELYQTQPSFREAIDRCDQILRSYLDQPLLEVLFPPSGESPLNETAYTQPALFALEYALAQLWLSWGLQPTAVLGHSVGEYVAACIAGSFSLEDGLKLVAARGRLMQALPPTGKMVALMATEAQVLPLLSCYREQVAIAAVNGPQSLVLSGEQAAVDELCTQLEAAGVKTKLLTVSHAFHSPLMQPMLAEFAQVAESIAYAPPQIDLVSNLTGKLIGPGELTAAYWEQHVIQPVRFADSMAHLSQQGYKIFVEIGPKPVLLGMAQTCLPTATVNESAWLPSLRPGQTDWQTLLESLSQLYVRGVSIDWAGFDRDYARRRVALPTYPFQRQPYSVETVLSHEKPKTAGLATPQTPVMQLLQQGDVEQLVQLLSQNQSFSEAQKLLLPELLQVLVQQHHQQSATASLQNCFYQVKWQPQPRQPQTDSPTSLAPATWLILADRSQVGAALADALEHQGHRCLLVYAGEDYQQQDSKTWRINPAQLADFEQLCQAAIAPDSPPLRHVVHLWSLDTAPPDMLDLAADLASLQQAQLLACGSALHLVQAISSQLSNAQLWLITRAAMPVDSSSPAVAQTPLWGMGRVISLEYPQFWGGMIDLAQQPAPDEVATLVTELQNAQGEDHLAFRQEQRYVARLLPQSLPELQPVRLRADGTYLITGGLGSLGLRVAQWIVEQGGRHLVLVSRRAASTEAEAAIAQLEQQGTTVHVAQADVASPDEIAEVLKTIDTQLPPLAGIIHAAGVSALQAIADIDLSTLETMLRPKIAGSWNLHALTQDKSLDFWVNFSSISSVWGSKGLAHYAAANHFLDGLAHYRRSLGQPALSINWGPWAEAGMATGESQADWLSRRGLSSLSTTTGMAALTYLLGSDRTQITVAEVDWTVLKRLYEAGGPRFLLEQLGNASSTAPTLQTQERDSLWQTLTDLPPEERQGQLVSHLQSEVGKVLGIVEADKLPELHQGFFDMGMDSLMAVELKARLEKSLATPLPATLVIEAPTLNSLAQYLAQEVLGWHSLPVASAKDQPEDEALLTEIEQLADESVDELLQQELAELESLLMES
jgi:malonyl CoA-acyl carrier protein transacylase